MLLQFSDRRREAHEQSRDGETVKLYVHGIGFIVIKLEQLEAKNLKFPQNPSNDAIKNSHRMRAGVSRK